MKYEHQVIVGDFNRQDIDWKNVATASDGDADFIEAYRGLIQLKPTRSRGSNQPSMLDLFFSSKAGCVESIEISFPLGKSDHSVIKFNVDPNLCSYLIKYYETTKRQMTGG